MKTFKVIVPEIREEYVHVEYKFEAEDKDDILIAMNNGTFFDNAEYIDTDSRYGFEVRDYEFDKAEIKELEDA